MNDALASYLPQDRRQALAHARALPAQSHGAALFADISGFTQLTEALTAALGQRRGVEALTDRINMVYDALVGQVDALHGSVIGFAGDAVTCWFDDADGPAARRAAACALAMQRAMRAFQAIALPSGATLPLALKVTVAAGPVRRFAVGDPAIHQHDTMASATIARMAGGDHLTSRGEVLIDAATAAALGPDATIAEWRQDAPDSDRFAVLAHLAAPPPAHPWPELPAGALSGQAMRPWLLPAVYERELAGQGLFLTELRPAVAMFLRFAGIDYDGDPQAGARLDSFMRLVQHAIAPYEGSLLQLTIGDKGSFLYIAFGAPTAHEDDARRAALAARDILRDVSATGVIEPPQIGIAQGAFRCGAYGAASRRTYGMLGDDVNLAARLMAAAAAGEIVVSGAVQAAIADDIALEPRAPIRVKGKAEPLPVFAVIGLRLSRAVRLQEPSYALPMIGRADELARLSQAIDRARAGQGQIVAISAEAGMGKSRLVAEGIRLARQLGMAGYGGACQATGTHSPYLVWQPIWRALFDVDPEAPTRRQRRALAGLLEDWAPERIDALPLLGPLLGLALPENDFTQRLEPKDRQGVLHALLRDCLGAAAREAAADGGGLLLVLEDAHWIDAASDELLRDLTRATRDLPVLLVLAYRPGEPTQATALERGLPPEALSIGLRPLAAAEADQLIRAKLAQLFPARTGAVPPALVARLTARAQGNPFYLEELLNYLRDRAIDPRDASALDALELPDSLHRLILSRIDGLSPRDQVALKVASVIGRRFLVAWLQGAFALAGLPTDIKAHLEAWAQIELTQLDTPEPELAYLFKHILTHEVAYASLASATRATLHGQLAAYLERAAGADVERHLDVLAHHYEQSGNLAKKREYLRRAGAAAAARYANDAALAYLGRALALAPADDRAERYALLMLREAVYEVRGERAQQAADLADLADLAAAEPARAAEVALRRARHAERTGDYPAALAAAHSAVELSASAGRPDLAATGHQRWGWVLLRQRDYAAARAQFDRSLELAAVADDRRQACLTLNDLGGLAAEQGDYSVARYFYEQSLRLARELGDRRQESHALGNLGTIAGEQGDLSGARAALEQGLALAHLIGDRQVEGNTLGNLGFLLALLGDYLAARRALEQALELTRATGGQLLEAYVLGNLGMVARNQGDYLAAREAYGRSLALAQGDAALAGWNRRGLGDLALAAGQLDAAEAAYQLSLATLQPLGSPALAAEPLAGLARVALARNDAAAALAHVEPILAQLQSGALDGAEEPALVYLSCYRALRAAADQRAGPLLARAHAELLARAERIADEPARRAFLEQVPAHRALAAAWAAHGPGDAPTGS